MPRYRSNAPRAYTLIEALAVIFIMIMMMTLLLANYGAGRSQQQLKKTGAEAMSALRQVQNDALSGLVIGVTKTYGYGVHFTTTTSYTLFADKNSNSNVYDSGEDLIDVSPKSRTFKDQITPVLYGACPISTVLAASADIVFRPPHPTVVLKGDGNACNKICAFFVSPSGTTRTKITVTGGSGLIDSIDEPTAAAPTCT